MTKVHHINVGTLKALPGDRNDRTICHCLLLEGPNGYALVDSGFSLIEMQQGEPYVEPLVKTWGLVLDESQTAVRQIALRGIDPAEVRDIVLTHLDFDHAGGLRDFPKARVHLSDEEFRSMKDGNPRYVSQQWKHKPQWHTYGASDTRWFGLEARSLHLENRSDALLIPLPGHTRGHCGVAIPDQGGKWLLHAADSYHRRIELSDRQSGVSAFTAQLAEDNEQRLRTQAELLRLEGEHGDEVHFFSTHDVTEFPDDRD